MLVRRFQHQCTAAGVFGFDRALAGNLPAEGFPDQVSHAFDAGGGENIAGHPLHCPCLTGNTGFGDVADQLTLPHIHLIAEESSHRRCRGYAQIASVLDNLEGAFRVYDPDVIVVCEVIDLYHFYIFLSE